MNRITIEIGLPEHISRDELEAALQHLVMAFDWIHHAEISPEPHLDLPPEFRPPEFHILDEYVDSLREDEEPEWDAECQHDDDHDAWVSWVHQKFWKMSKGDAE